MIVFLDYPGTALPPREFEAEMQREYHPHIHIHSTDPAALENDPSVNCHGYACLVAGVPGLPRPVWIRSDFSAVTSFSRSLDVLLETFFTKTAEGPTQNEIKLALGFFDAKAGDLISFIDETGERIHSGILIARPGGTLWVRSKFAEQSTFDTPLYALQTVYPHASFEIWRR